MRKGIQVKLKKSHRLNIPGVYRHTTPEERSDWYERLHEECRAGRNVGYDSAGEPKLAPMCAAIAFCKAMQTSWIPCVQPSTFSNASRIHAMG